MSMRTVEQSDESFAGPELERRRRAARRLGFALAAGALALYVAGFWLQR